MATMTIDDIRGREAQRDRVRTRLGITEDIELIGRKFTFRYQAFGTTPDFRGLAGGAAVSGIITGAESLIAGGWRVYVSAPVISGIGFLQYLAFEPTTGGILAVISKHHDRLGRDGLADEHVLPGTLVLLS